MNPKHAIILAAGKGTRFSESTGSEVPKPLYPINGLPLIEHSIRNLLSLGVEQIHIGCGFHKQAFAYLETDYEAVRLSYNPYYESRSSLYTLEMFKEEISEATWVLEGDLLYEVNALERLAEQFETESLILCTPPLEIDDNVYYRATQGRLLELSKTLPTHLAEGVMTGIWILEAGLLGHFSSYCSLQPEAYTRDYEVMLAEFSRDQLPIYVYHSQGIAWCEIDHDEHLSYALEHVLPKLSY